ncbi:MAG: restriction endonuclease subunit S, partial [Candidatus Poribacteria bacterium]|nr:restriction endonuclease subunit S [Candidatus Poribacteria bacterium]
MLTEFANDLPKGWVWTQVKKIAEFIRGVSYRKSESSKTPKTDYVPILRANNINRKLNFEDLVYVPREKVKDEQFVKALDVIIAMSSGSKHLVGKAAQAYQDFEGGFGTFCGLVRGLPQIDRKFIGLFFQSPDYRNEISNLSIGININNLRRENVESMPIPLPPLAEQHRIVAKLETLFTQLDAAVDSLKKAQVQLQRYRQSILKAAFEGELTREWRKGHSDELEPMSVSEVFTTDSLSELPDGWVWTKIKDIAEFIRGVSYKKNQSSKTPIDGYVPILRANNIDTQLNFEDLVYVPREKVKDEQFIKALDIIIATSSGSKHLVGKAAQAYQDFEGGFGTFCG